jgi:hypothetical protein
MEVFLKLLGIYFIIGLWIAVFVTSTSFMVGKATPRAILEWLLKVLFVSITYIVLMPFYIYYELLGR